MYCRIVFFLGIVKVISCNNFDIELKKGWRYVNIRYNLKEILCFSFMSSEVILWFLIDLKINLYFLSFSDINCLFQDPRYYDRDRDIGEEIRQRSLAFMVPVKNSRLSKCAYH